MLKIHCLLLILVCASTSVKSQERTRDTSSFELASIEGTPETIYVRLDVDSGRIYVKSEAGYSLCFADVMGLDEVPRILGNRFLELDLTVRGGSGIWNRLYLLICVAGRKPKLAFDYFTSSYWTSPYFDDGVSTLSDPESEDASLNFLDIRISDSVTWLIACMRDTITIRKSPDDTAEVSVKVDTLRFKFDQVATVFYESDEVMSRDFVLKSSADTVGRPEHLRGKSFRIRRFAKDKEILIGDDWYGLNPTDSALWLSCEWLDCRH